MFKPKNQITSAKSLNKSILLAEHTTFQMQLNKNSQLAEFAGVRKYCQANLENSEQNKIIASEQHVPFHRVQVW